MIAYRNCFIKILLIGVWLVLTSPAISQSSDGNDKKSGTILQAARFLGEGVLKGRYKKPGWREFVMPDRIELPAVLPASLPPHPRLLSKSRLMAAQHRIYLSPQISWYRLMKEEADIPIQTDSRRVRFLAKQAKACAMLYALGGGQSYADKAAALLNRLPEPPAIIDLEGGAPNTGWGDYLQSAESIPDLCVAYDLLETQLPIPLKQEFQRKLMGVVEQLLDAFRFTPRNNHITVMSIAAATAALSFDELRSPLARSPAELYAIAMEHLSLSLGLVAPDGGYGEGVYYARYISSYLAPFAVHLENALSLKLYDHPYLRRMVDWMIDNHKGGGSYSQFDDAYGTRFFFLPLLIRGDTRQQNWQQHLDASKSFPRFRSGMAEALLVYRPVSLEFQLQPEFAARFYPDIGQVIFRGNGFFAGVVFERERWFADVHEQVEPVAMELSAFGEDFIVDGGYGSGTGDADRPYFISPEANSTLLVDGRGSDPNPLIGDPVEARLLFGFSTPAFAAAAVAYSIGDADLERRFFYNGGWQLLVVDRMEGSRPHVYSAQFNYRGRFRDRGNGRLLWQQENAEVEAQILGGEVSIREDAGLTTLGSRVENLNRVTVETPPVRQAEWTLLWTASKAAEPAEMQQLPLTSGSGEWRRTVNAATGEVEDVLLNTGGEISTPFCSSDARLLWLRRKADGRLRSVLIEEGRQFRWENLWISASFPVTLYLEQNGSGWAGYLQYDRRRGELILETSDFLPEPLRLNGAPVALTRQPGEYRIVIPKPGTLAFGSGEPLVQLPVSYREDADFLTRIRRGTELRRDATNWSDYEQAVFKNQVTRNLLSAADDVFAGWGASLTGDSLWFRHLANAAQGLLQYSYRSGSGGDGFRLPHRYRVDGRSFYISEEGDWRGGGVDVRYLDARGRLTDNLQVDYGYQNPFSGYQSQRLGIGWRGAGRLDANYIRAPDQTLQNYRVLLYRPNWQAMPAVLLRQGKLSALRLDGQVGTVRTSIRRTHLQGQPETGAVLEGLFRQRLNWRLSGEDAGPGNPRHYTADFSAAAGRTQLLSGGIQLDQSAGWELARGRASWGGILGKVRIYQRWWYAGGEHWWAGRFSGTAGAGYWSISGFRQTSAQAVSMDYASPLKKHFGWTSRLDYLRPETSGAGRTVWHQQFILALRRYLHLLPGWRLQVTRGTRTLSPGIGFTLLQPVIIYLNASQDRSLSLFLNRVDGGAVLPAAGLRANGILLWRSGALLYAEMRLQQLAGAGVSPGLFYRYLYPGETRLEGSLEWRW